MPLGLPAASLPGHPTTGPLVPETQLLGELTPGARSPFPRPRRVTCRERWQVRFSPPRPGTATWGGGGRTARWRGGMPSLGPPRGRMCVWGGPWNGGAGQVGRRHLTVGCTLGSVSRSSCRLRRLRGGRAERGADRASPRFGERAPAAAGAPGAASSLTPAAPLVSVAHSRT